NEFSQVTGRGLVDLPASLTRIDTERVAGAGHGDVEETAFLLIVEKPVIRKCRVSIPQFARKRHDRLAVTAGERWLDRTQDEDMWKLKALGAVDGHQANGILVFVCLQGNDSPCLAEIGEVVDQFLKFGGLIDLFLLPGFDELQGCLENRRTAVQKKLTDNDFQGS